jgi:hypothetical protein
VEGSPCVYPFQIHVLVSSPFPKLAPATGARFSLTYDVITQSPQVPNPNRIF